jgi:putative tryptophan/tyrosine transport system substrate-binding protein
MRRREFIALAAIGWSCAARAQQTKQTIGFLSSVSPGPWAPLVGAFRKGLNETGFMEGQNVTIEFRWAEGLYDALPTMATTW